MSTGSIDFTSWNREHWKLFIITSISFLIDGLIFSISPILIYSISTLVTYATYILGINMLSWTFGSIILGKLGDIIGRRSTFMIVLILEILSIALLCIFYTNLYMFTLLTSLACFAIGGEFGAAFSAQAELMPPQHRGRSILLSSNFWNLGAVLISLISILCTRLMVNTQFQIRTMLYTVLLIIVLTAFARFGFPESIRWLVVKGRIDKARVLLSRYSLEISNDFVDSYRKVHGISLLEAFSKYFYRVMILLIITLSVYVTYFIPAFYLPYTPDFPFRSYIPYIVLIANLGSFVGAFMLVPLIDRCRRISTLISLLGGLATSCMMIVALAFRNIISFFILLFLNMVFSQWSWACLSVLQSELFPTGIRSTIIGFFVSFEGILTAILTFMESILTSILCMAIIVALWLAGSIAALSWYFRGIETAGISVDKLVQ